MIFPRARIPIKTILFATFVIIKVYENNTGAFAVGYFSTIIIAPRS
jgi:hypothetical protein